jgi:hypothetical protein
VDVTDSDHTLTLKGAARQLGVSEKTLRRRLARPDHGGLDAVRVATPQGYTWRLRLVSPVHPGDMGTGVDSPTADRPDIARPAGQDAGLDRAVSTLRDIVVAQQRRLEDAAEERGRLLALVEALQAQHLVRPGARQRPWWRFWYSWRHKE